VVCRVRVCTVVANSCLNDQHFSMTVEFVTDCVSVLKSCILVFALNNSVSIALMFAYHHGTQEHAFWKTVVIFKLHFIYSFTHLLGATLSKF